MAIYHATFLTNTNIEENNGKWAVATGKKNEKYFLTTVCDTEEEAKREAALWTMRDYFVKAEEVYRKAVENGLLDDDNMMEYLC